MAEQEQEQDRIIGAADRRAMDRLRRRTWAALHLQVDGTAQL
jgi:hypothetical protein